MFIFPQYWYKFLISFFFTIILKNYVHVNEKMIYKAIYCCIRLNLRLKRIYIILENNFDQRKRLQKKQVNIGIGFCREMYYVKVLYNSMFFSSKKTHFSIQEKIELGFN